jgi:hypothetical protein
MSTNALETQKEKPVARPLHVLVPLIKDDLKQAAEAAQRAGMPYYIAAGKKMIEAKDQVGHGEFEPWIKRNFGITPRHARRYMEFARATSNTTENGPTGPFSSLEQFRRHLGERRTASWQEPIKQALNKVDVELLNVRRDELKRADESNAQRELALQLIDIGYKALASKLHPDKGGSRDAMARLNQVRKNLKGSGRAGPPLILSYTGDDLVDHALALVAKMTYAKRKEFYALVYAEWIVPTL